MPGAGFDLPGRAVIQPKVPLLNMASPLWTAGHLYYSIESPLLHPPFSFIGRCVCDYCCPLTGQEG